MLFGDCAPNLRPDEQRCPVTVSDHKIGIFRGLELRLIAKFVHHRVGGPHDLEVRQHYPLPSLIGPTETNLPNYTSSRETPFYDKIAIAVSVYSMLVRI